MINEELVTPSAGSRAEAVETRSWRFVPATKFEDYEHSWTAVFAQTRRPPILEARFLKAALRVFGSGDEVLAICGDPQSPVAIGVFRRIGVGSWETFNPAQTPLSAWMQHPALDYESVLPGLVAALPGFAVAVGITQKDPAIVPRPAESSQLEVLDYVRTARVLVNRSFDEYWASRDRKTRYEIQRRHKRLTESGLAPRLEIVRDPGHVDAAIEDYGRLESGGWKGKAGTAVSGDNDQGLFYKMLLRDFCSQGRARIYRLYFGEQLVAMQLCVEADGTLVFLKTTYDEEHRRYSPGILLKHAIFEDVFRDGSIRNIEFYGSVLEWQEKWMDEGRTLYHVTYYRWSWLPALKQARNLLATRSAARQPAGIEGDEAGEAGAEALNVQIYDDLAQLPASFEKLFETAGESSIYHTLVWYRNYARTVIGPDDRVRIYAVQTRSGQPKGVLLMHHARKTRPFGLSQLRGLANYYSSLFGPVVDPRDPDLARTLEAIARAIARDSIRWGIVDLHPIALDDMFPALVKALKGAGFLVHQYFRFGNWYLDVAGKPFEQYFDGRPSRLSKTAKRQRRKVTAGTRFEFKLYTKPDDLERGLADYNTVYGSSWKVSEPYPNFVGGLMRACAEQGWLRLGVAYMDGQPAAAQFWIHSGSTTSIFKMAYDERYAKDSVGTVLSSLLMENAIDKDKATVVDYLSGDDPYKQDWMSDRRERWGIVALNLRTPYGLYAGARHVASLVVKRLIRFIRERRRPAA